MIVEASTVSPGYPRVFIGGDIGGHYTRSEVLELIGLLASELDKAANESKRLERERDGG